MILNTSRPRPPLWEPRQIIYCLPNLEFVIAHIVTRAVLNSSYHENALSRLPIGRTPQCVPQIGIFHLMRDTRYIVAAVSMRCALICLI